MRTIGIDFGMRHIGIALSDEKGKVAFPHSVIPYTKTLVDDVALLIEKEKVTCIVIGESKDFTLKDNPVMKEARAFGDSLAKKTGLSVFYHPEFLTTQEARRDAEEGKRQDARAAALILSNYLDMHTHTEEKKEKELEKQETVTIDDFQKIHIAIGTVTAVSRIPDADKLLQLTVEIGEERPRTIVSGIAPYFENIEELVGKQFAFAINLPPRTLRGVTSEGMILATGDETAFAILTPSQRVPSGSRVR